MLETWVLNRKMEFEDQVLNS